MLHIEGRDAGPEGGGQKRRRPAKHQVQPVVVGGVIQEYIDHQNVVKVQALKTLQKVLKILDLGRLVG